MQELPPSAFVVGDVYVYLDPWCPNDGRLRRFGWYGASPPFAIANPVTAATLMQCNLAAAYRPEGVP